MRETLFDFASRLNHVKEIIDWEKFRPILSNLYNNRTEKGGRPNIDEITMLRVLVLQNWYNSSDQIRSGDGISTCRQNILSTFYRFCRDSRFFNDMEI